MKILFLTDEFYPTFGANSLLVRTLAQELMCNEHEVFVMPFAYESALPSEEIWNGIHVIRCIRADDKQLLLDNLRKGSIATAAKIGFKYVRGRICPKRQLLPKDRIAARGVLETFIKEQHIDAVISICCSIELSFPLLYLRKKNKLPCRWLFYMIDPFESHSYYRSIEKTSVLRRVQHDIMMHCDAVVATELIYNDTKQWEAEEILSKISVVEFPKIEKPFKQACEDGVELSKEKINIVCTGSKNEQVRNSEYTMQLCERFKDENVIFHFIGHGWCEAEQNNCIFYCPRSHEAVRNLQMDANFLLNIGNVVTNQLPSKILEYISTGKPIINVCKSAACPTLALLKGDDALHLLESDEIEKSYVKLKDFIYAERTAVSFEEIQKQYKIYTPAYVAKQILSILQSLN